MLTPLLGDTVTPLLGDAIAPLLEPLYRSKERRVSLPRGRPGRVPPLCEVALHMRQLPTLGRVRTTRDTSVRQTTGGEPVSLHHREDGREPQEEVRAPEQRCYAHRLNVRQGSGWR
jgi:hypothetical protein